MGKELIEKMCDGMTDILYQRGVESIDEMDEEEQIEVCRMAAKLIHFNGDMEYDDVIEFMSENHKDVMETLECAVNRACLWHIEDEREEMDAMLRDMEDEMDIEEAENMIQEEECKDWGKYDDAEYE